jgi:hypothetical protein
MSNGTGRQANDPPVHSLFLLHSRFNHFCVPNSRILTSGGEIIASFTTRDIVAGKEITFCYNSDLIIGLGMSAIEHRVLIPN